MERCSLSLEVFDSFHIFSFLRQSTTVKGILVFAITSSYNHIYVSLPFILIFYIFPDDYLWCASTHDQSKDSTFYLKGDPSLITYQTSIMVKDPGMFLRLTQIFFIVSMCCA